MKILLFYYKCPLRNELVGYGFTHLPSTPGLHKIEVRGDIYLTVMSLGQRSEKSISPGRHLEAIREPDRHDISALPGRLSSTEEHRISLLQQRQISSHHSRHWLSLSHTPHCSQKLPQIRNWMLIKSTGMIILLYFLLLGRNYQDVEKLDETSRNIFIKSVCFWWWHSFNCLQWDGVKKKSLPNRGHF